jgi:peroxiredoxin
MKNHSTGNSEEPLTGKTPPGRHMHANRVPDGDNFLFDNSLPPSQIPPMVAVNSTMLPLGTRAPDFRLPDTNGKMVSLADFENANALLVIFMCNHCPYVKHIRSGLAQLARDYLPRGVAMVGISSNDVENYPQDSPRKMAEEAKAAGYIFPYLYDETQEVAKAYRAACTPDLYLFDGEQRLVYRGQLDDSRPGSNLPVTGKDVRSALDALLAGKPMPPNQRASIGCNIKWKPGNEPEYFR